MLNWLLRYLINKVNEKSLNTFEQMGYQRFCNYISFVKEEFSHCVINEQKPIFYLKNKKANVIKIIFINNIQITFEGDLYHDNVNVVIHTNSDNDFGYTKRRYFISIDHLFKKLINDLNKIV